jgi:hypothetical protein
MNFLHAMVARGAIMKTSIVTLGIVGALVLAFSATTSFAQASFANNSKFARSSLLMPVRMGGGSGGGGHGGGFGGGGFGGPGFGGAYGGGFGFAEVTSVGWAVTVTGAACAAWAA